MLFIHWNPDPVFFEIGSFAVRWYGVLWILGLLAVYLLEHKLYKEQRIAEEKFDPLFFYCFFGIIIGARLGHCIFYEPERFLTSWQGIVTMILPIKFDSVGNWHFTGYEGLASHGGTLGLMFALWLFVRKTGLKLLMVLDNIAIVTPICAGAIRLANLMNSEIIGKVTDVPWAFVFERVDMQPRHPGQLYEALCYFVFFFVGWAFYRRRKQWVGTGFFFGLCIFLIFTARILIEYVKENQVDFESGMLLNMGQLLSVPFVLLGAFCMWRALRKPSEEQTK